MAGAGYKLFATGDVLTAAQVNTYLMQQTVMVFASSAARTTALSGVLAEGMVSYLQDTNTLEVYDGSAWVGATGDITGLTAGTGISISSATGPVPTVAIDTATTVDKTTAQTLTNKTLTSPVLTTPSISNIEAKGDILVGTADNTLGVITAGANGETIVADSSQAVGLRWQAPVNANPIINSNFSVWQRGTSFAIPANTSTYGADRWTSYRSGATGSTVSRQVTGDTTNLPFIQYCARVQRDSGNTSTAILYFTSPVESVNTIPYAGKTVTYSFYARAGANYSATSGVLNSSIYSGTGIDQSPYSGYTNGAAYGSTNNTLTTTWQRFSATYTFPTNHSEMAIQFQFTPVGTAGANDYFEVTGVQFEVGSVATPYKPTGATFQGETSACQRYYWRWNGGSDAQYGGGFAISTTAAFMQFTLPVQMRIAPSSIENNLMSIADGGTAYTGGTWTIARNNNISPTLQYATSAVLVQHRFYMGYTSSTSAYLGFSAEL